MNSNSKANTNAKNNTAKRNARSIPTWAEIEQADTGKTARIERWRAHAKSLFDTVKSYQTPALYAVANAANMSPVEYVIAYMSEMRGLAGHHAEDDWTQKYNRVMDIENETMHTRTRNNEEKLEVRQALFILGAICVGVCDEDFTAQELQTLAVRFMRKGEWTLNEAIVRAAKAAIA